MSNIKEQGMKEALEQALVANKNQLLQKRILERYLQRRILDKDGKGATQPLAETQKEIKEFTTFISFLEECAKEE